MWDWQELGADKVFDPEALLYNENMSYLEASNKQNITKVVHQLMLKDDGSVTSIKYFDNFCVWLSNNPNVL